MQSFKESEEELPDKPFKIEQKRKNTISTSSKTSLKNELEKAYYKEDFLDRFDLPEKLNVSAVIPTYNRCPYNPKKPEGKFNPLFWCLESLINQRPKLNEIIVINDNSNDYTKQVVKKIKEKAKEKDIKFISLINKENRGSSISRNIGSKKATSDLLFFMDDDCIAKKYSIFGLFYTLKRLSEEEIKVGAIHTQIYTRLIYPSSIIKIDRIGRLNLEKGEYTWNLNKFPKKYLKNDFDKFLDKDYKILKPIQIQNLSGCFLTPKKRFLTVKGFPRFFTWKNSHGEETELACRFMENGYSLFFCPDPKFGLYHGKFGESSKIPINKKYFNKYKKDKIIDELSLAEINEECSKPRLNTGNRVPIKEWYYSKIISLFVIFYPRNMTGALNWVANTKKIFVEENDKNFGGGKWAIIKEEDKRENIWYTAILDGLELVTKKDKDEIWDFLKGLEELRKFKTINGEKMFSGIALKKILS